ncbi:MAG: hypothetical protein HY746_04105 [Elusimicrobia bacterium]|nr:hypothetical protein [Elusimicrobiota bacterium]
MEKLSANFNRISAVAGFVVSAASFFLPVINPDLFWHLASGRFILETGKIPDVDFLSWTMSGKEWLDFEWFTQIVYWLLFLKGGLPALLILKAFILGACLFFFWKLSRLYNLEKLSFISFPLLTLGLLPNNDVRPENFTLLFFTAQLYFLESARLGKIGSKTTGYAAFVSAGFCLWANLHAGYLYGLALFLVYFLGEGFEENLPWIYGKRGRVIVKKSAVYLKYFFAGGLASFLNPYLWKIYKVAWNHQAHLNTLQEYIQEWKPFDLTNAYQWPYVFILVFSFSVILARFIKSRDVPYAHLAGMFFFAYSSANYSRHSIFFSVTGLSFAIFAISRGRLPSGKTTAGAVAAVFICILIYFRAFIFPMYSGRISAFEDASGGAVNFLKANSEHLAKLKMFNYWGWGGYLGFHLYPEYRVFIDGRYIFHSFLEETENSRNNPENWNKFLAKWDFRLAIIPRGESKVAVKHRFKNGKTAVLYRPAYLAYLPKKNWAVVYWDKKCVILAERNSASRNWLKMNEYKYLRADDTFNLAMAVLENEIPVKDVEREILRFINLPDLEESMGKETKVWWERLLKAKNKAPQTNRGAF